MRQANLFKALGNPKRMAILKVLLRTNRLPVTELAQRIGLSFKSTSKHLLLLEKLDLIKREQKRTWGFYSLNKSLAGEIKKLLKVAAEITR